MPQHLQRRAAAAVIERREAAAEVLGGQVGVVGDPARLLGLGGVGARLLLLLTVVFFLIRWRSLRSGIELTLRVLEQFAFADDELRWLADQGFDTYSTTIEVRADLIEKNPKADSFFRKGRTGTWGDSLTGEQASRVIDDHREVMERFGYLQGGEPVF